MANFTRRSFVKGTAALSLASAASSFNAPRLFASSANPLKSSKRILVGTNKGENSGNIQAFNWDAATGTLTPDGVAATLPDSTWLEVSPDRKFLYVASELSEFQGKPTGAISSFRLNDGKLQPLSQANSASVGTCHVGVDHTGNVLISADYGGGSAASFVSAEGKLTGPQWSEHYGGYAEKGAANGLGPVADRQESAHAHFASYSPDNRFAFVNDLGGDEIHIYKMDTGSAQMLSVGTYNASPGDGPRTLHFHPNGKVAYCVNELASTVKVLGWNENDRALMPIQTVALLPEGFKGVSRACDTVITRDGHFAYFANRDNDFLISFRVDEKTGKLTPLGENPRTSCGGKIPRNFVLDPTEQWMLVANQDSGNLSVFARDPKTGVLANEGKNVPLPKPMCIVFV
jgi:6-phosphogluconolactonase